MILINEKRKITDYLLNSQRLNGNKETLIKHRNV
jgi:hypothetical protein